MKNGRRAGVLTFCMLIALCLTTAGMSTGLAAESDAPVIEFAGGTLLTETAGTTEADFTARLASLISVRDENTSDDVAFTYPESPFDGQDKLKAGKYTVKLNVSDEDGNAAEEVSVELYAVSDGVDFSSDLEKPANTNGVNLKAFGAGELDAAPNTLEAWINLPKDGGGNGNGATRYGVVFGNFVTGSVVNTAKSCLLEIYSGNIDLYWKGKHYRCTEGVGNVMPGKSADPQDYVVRTGEWVHVAVVRNLTNGTLDFYKNGGMIGQMTATGKVSEDIDEVLPFYVGNDGRSRTAEHRNAVFMGRIGSVSAWSDVRTAEQIRENMIADYPDTEPGLLEHVDISARVTETRVSYAGGGLKRDEFTTAADLEEELRAAGTIAALDPVDREIPYTFAYSQGAVTEGVFRTPGKFTVTVSAQSPAYGDSSEAAIALEITDAGPVAPQIVYSGDRVLTFDRAAEDNTEESVFGAILEKTEVIDDTAVKDDLALTCSGGMFGADGRLNDGAHSVDLTLTDGDGLSAEPVRIAVYAIGNYVDFVTDTTGTPKTDYAYSTGKALDGNPNTMEAWINIPTDVALNTGSPHRVGSLIGSWVGGSSQADSYALEFHSDGTVILYWGTYVRLTAPASVPKVKTGKWTHVAVTRDTPNHEVKFYINGKPCASVDIAGTPLMTDVATGDAGLTLWIGKDGRAEDGKYTGKSASVAIFGSVRSEAEIAGDMADMLTEPRLSAPGLLYFANLGKMAVDSVGPEITVKYAGSVVDGASVVKLTEGDARPEFEVTAIDEISGECLWNAVFSDGAADIYGEMNPGSHTVTFTASDTAGNSSSVTVRIEVKEKGGGSGGGEEIPGGGGEAGTDKGCGAKNAALPVSLLLAGAMIFVRRKPV